MKTQYVNRIRLISIFVFLFALLLVGRLYLLQVVQSDVYQDKAERQYSSTARGIFSRGSIYFSNKDGSLVSAATLKSGSIVTINPQILKNPEDAFYKLSSVLPVKYDTFIAKASKKNDPYEEIAVRQTLEVGEEVDALKITGLKAVKDRWRFYPGGKTAAHVIGMLGYKGDDYAGRYGLESQFDQNLERKNGAYTNFFAQIFQGIKSVNATSSAEEADIITTIEPTAQAYLEGVLASTTEKWSADLTGGIIMDPNTGEIIAMEVYPTFDLNHPEEVEEALTFSNPLVENVYEMGSIIKPLTVAAGIDTGVITASSTYYDSGSIWVSGKKISNFDGKARGTASIQDLLSQSLNVGAAYVEGLLGKKRFSEYMFAFGINKKTSIELPNEAKNLVDNLNTNIDVNFATASFGQGIALTPISTIRALATIANGGILIQPHLVKSVDYKLGFSKETKINGLPRVITKQTSESMARLLTYSFDNVLSNGQYKIPNYSVAVKTGTAQVAKQNGRGYEEDKFLHSFVGYFPSYNPKFIVFLFIVNPRGAKYSSETLAEPFSGLTRFLINYYEVPPDR
ncbi:MAG: penicillin-binding protein 2 [Minisyncoccia bacterium]